MHNGVASGEPMRFDRCVAAKLFFITGTDTGVGKTVFTAAFAAHLHRKGLRVAALKPIASGGSADARMLRAAVANTLTLEEINPWHFKRAVAPVIAAREEGRGVRLAEVVSHVRGFVKSHEVVLVEAAGGLLSPLGEGFDCRDLLKALRAWPVVVCPDRVGAVNQARLVWEALPRGLRDGAWLVLAEQGKGQAAKAGNAEMLRAFAPMERLLVIPWLNEAMREGRGPLPVAFRKAIGRLSQVTIP